MSLLPDKHIFVLWRGATFTSRLTLYSDAGVTLRNLTGYTADLTVYASPGGSTLLSLTTGNGGITLGGSGGTIDLLVTDDATAAFLWNSGVYELFIESAGGIRDPLLYGSFAIKGL